MNAEESEKYLAILNRYKTYFGMSDYTVILKPRLKARDDKYAEADSDHYNRTLTVQLFTGFKSLDEQEKIKKLVHEIIHSRYGIFESKVEALVAEEEEAFIIDVTNGVMAVEKK